MGNLSYKSRVISSKTTASFSDVEFLAKPIGEVARRAPDKFNLPVLINHSQSSAKEANSEIKLYRQVFAILNGSPVECLRMDVEIDQSGKVEQTDRPTAIALANGIRFSILISAQAKTEVFDELAVRQPGRNRKQIKTLFFAALVYLLLKEHIHKIDYITIDDEYQGHGPTIKEHVLNLCRNHNIAARSEQIRIGRIGKTSPAHAAAIEVFQGKVAPQRRITAKEILAEFRTKRQ